MGRLEGQSALVTGGGSGIGRAVVERFVAEGAHVGVLDVAADALDDIVADLGDDVVGVEGDVTEFEDNERAVEETVGAFGGLDTFVGNAGVFDLKVSLEELDPGQIEPAYEELFGVNVLGYLYGAKAAIPELRRVGGNVVFTASCSGYMPATGGVLYVPSKHAVVGLVRQLAHELAPEVRVNGVAPGYVPTGLTGLRTLEQGPSPPSPHFEAVNPIGTVPAPEDYAGYYVFLADDEASLPTTGVVVSADGGLSVRGIT